MPFKFQFLPALTKCLRLPYEGCSRRELQGPWVSVFASQKAAQIEWKRARLILILQTPFQTHLSKHSRSSLHFCFFPFPPHSTLTKFSSTLSIFFDTPSIQQHPTLLTQPSTSFKMTGRKYTLNFLPRYHRRVNSLRLQPINTAIW